MSHTVEFVTKNLRDFDASRHITVSRVQEGTDGNGLSVFIFMLLWTKVSAMGENAYWVKQDSPADPQEAFLNHLWVNNLPTEAVLFSWKHTDGLRVLMWTEFIKWVEEVARSYNSTV